jgi:hypothetical protein
MKDHTYLRMLLQSLEHASRGATLSPGEIAALRRLRGPLRREASAFWRVVAMLAIVAILFALRLGGAVLW